jgi:tellurite resistance protein TerC
MSSASARLLRRLVPVREEYAGARFFVIEAGKRVATPLLAVSDDPFIVYSSNAFAILGLRALYFLLAGMLNRFHLLSKGLALILAFIGVELVLQAAHETINPAIPEIPSPVSLAVIVVVLTVSIVLSLRRPVRPEPAAGGPDEPESRPER